MGGDTLDESSILKGKLKNHPNLRIASADTIEYAFNELREGTKKLITRDGVCHQINEHAGFNRLLPLRTRRLTGNLPARTSVLIV